MIPWITIVGKYNPLFFIIMKGFFYETLSIKNSFLLLLTAAIWGSAFVAQSVGMDYVKPFTFNGVRSAIGALFLIPCIFFFQNRTNSSEVSPADQLNQSAKTLASSPIARKTLSFGAMLWHCAGSCFFLQQIEFPTQVLERLAF